MDKSFKINDIKKSIKFKYNSIMKIWYLKIGLLSLYGIIIVSIIAVYLTLNFMQIQNDQHPILTDESQMDSMGKQIKFMLNQVL